MSLLRGSCVDIYGIDCRFSLDIWLRLLGLPLLNLRAIILIVVDSLSVVRHFVGASSAIILRSRAASSDLCMTIQDNAAIH